MGHGAWGMNPALVLLTAAGEAGGRIVKNRATIEGEIKGCLCWDFCSFGIKYGTAGLYIEGD